ncbi:hypothetical protein D3C81_1203430 [compost metagenome]
MGLALAAQHDVEAVSQAVHGVGVAHVELGDQLLHGFWVGDRLDDRALGDQWVALEVQLGNQLGGDRRAADAEMDVRRAPIIRAIAPWVRAGLDGTEAVVAVTVGQATTHTAEVRVQRGQVTVVLVAVAAASIGLPHFHQGVGHRFAVLVDHPAGNDDALTDRQAAVVEVQQQVMVVGAETQVGEIRAGGFADRLRDADQCLARRAGNGSLVVGRQGFGVPVAITDHEAAGVLGGHAVFLSWNYQNAYTGQADLQFRITRAG